MKKIIFTVVLNLLFTNGTAQVAIGKTSVTNTSVLLEFDNATTNKKGIILSAVENINKATEADLIIKGTITEMKID